jgi:DNA-binding beta-propeller fold protein YncE
MIRLAAAAAVLVLAGLMACSLIFADAGTPGYHVLKKTTLGGDGGWDYLTFDEAGRRLYIARSNRVMVVDADQDKVVGEVANTPGVHGVALVPDKGHGYSSNGIDGTVTVFDLKTLEQLERIKVGRGPDAIIYDASTGRVFTFNAGTRDSTAIDVATNKVVGSVKLPGKPEFAVADGKGLVFVNIEDKDAIVAFDGKEMTVKNTWSLAPGKRPSGLAMDRENRRLFAVCSNQKMIVMDADSGKVVAEMKIGNGPDACTFDPEAKLAFSSNGEGTLTIVKEESPDKFEVVANVPTQAGARTMALDSKNHQIYLVTARQQADAGRAKGRRRSFQPGTFMVLVVGK